MFSKIMNSREGDYLVPIAISQKFIMPFDNINLLLQFFLANFHEFVKQPNFGLTLVA